MKKTFIITLLVAITLSGCNWLKDFGDTNTNPAATTSPITAALLTNVESGLGGTWAGQGLYCQYFSETQYPDFSCYQNNQASPMGIYSGQLYDLQNIIIVNSDDATKAAAEIYGANANQIAIARILQTYIYWTITDRWGDVPYSEALQGNPVVAFDTQESIYKSMITTLTGAIAQFTAGAVIKGDIVYGGDIAKWKKAANSMRMLMALRLSKRYPGAAEYAATEFKAALADANGSIATNADNFTLNYPGVTGFKNPFYNMYDGRKDYGESETLTTLMVDTLGGDARSNVFGADVNGGASTLGVPYGWNRTDITNWTNTNVLYTWVLAPSVRQANSPLRIIRAASVLLARAEAAKLGWTTEVVNTLYQAGITASFTEWGLTAPDAAYLTKPAVALAGDAKDIKKIHRQQYLAYCPDGLQGWSNWRRTGQPVLSPARDASNTPPVIPRRYKYYTTDYSLNKAAVEAAVALITGGDEMNSRVWWDKL